MKDVSPVRPKQNPQQSAPTLELSFIHESAANCYEFLKYATGSEYPQSGLCAEHALEAGNARWDVGGESEAFWQ
jgi:hypothetical protein